MSAFMWVGAVLATVVAPALLSLLQKEAEGWIELLPKGLLRLALRRLPVELRERYAEEWVAELYAAAHQAERRPLSRLVLSVQFTSGLLLRAAPDLAREIRSTCAVEGDVVGPPTVALAEALTASGGRVAMRLDDLGRRWLLPTTPEALSPEAMFMVDTEGHFLGVAFPERIGGSLQPYMQDGQLYVLARVEFSAPDDPGRSALEAFVQRFRQRQQGPSGGE